MSICVSVSHSQPINGFQPLQITQNETLRKSLKDYRIFPADDGILKSKPNIYPYLFGNVKIIKPTKEVGVILDHNYTLHAASAKA